MSQILKKVLDVNDNDSEAVKETLATFFQNLSKHKESECNIWLRTLNNIISRFPKYCTTHRSTIESYLTNFLDSRNYYNVIEVAKCGHALQQVRPSQEKAATPKVCWREHMNVLCNSAHQLISAIFTDSVDIYNSGNVQRQQLQSTANSMLAAAIRQLSSTESIQNDMNQQNMMCIRLRNLFVCIQAMLVEIYPVAKPIRPQIILEVIVRALSVSSGQCKLDPVDVSLIKIQALRTVDALIACLGSNLIPFSALVFRIAMQTLKWSSENPSDESRNVRCSAYSSLTAWLNVLHAHRVTAARGRCLEDELTQHIIDDITPTQKVIQLTMSTQPTRHLSKKARKKLANSMLKESSIASHAPGEKNKTVGCEEMYDDVAIAALDCTETFLVVCGVFMKPTTHKIFQERLVRECYNIDNYSTERSLCLLRALESARKSTSSNVAPPTQYCLHLYSMLLNHKQREIAKFCSQALLDIRLHLHCSPLTLNFALEIPLDRKTAENKKNTVSKKNRAVLESLLGAERMPSKHQEEVITIADEPSRKKLRLSEDITDQISVSSESVNSVEISDDSEQDNDQSGVELIEDEKEEDSNCNEVHMEPIPDDRSESNTETNGHVTLKTIVEKEKNGDNSAKTIKERVPKQNNIENGEEKTIDNGSNNQNIQNIYEATTQLPLNNSNDTLDEEESRLSMEVAYDYPNTGTEKVPVLEKMDDENLPSTNDTDDIQITCGQVANSQDFEKNNDLDVGKFDSEIEVAIEVNNEVPKINGIDETPRSEVGNGDVIGNTVTVKLAASNEITVEDMLADFVDEVNEDVKT